MTETTTTPTEPTPEAPTGPAYPADILLNLIAIFLAPMFLTASGGDINFARMAAIETVNAYRARNHADLIAIAQIVAFGLAALGSLSLSMADENSLSMTLRLRGNANALDRSAERNRRALRERLPEKATPTTNTPFLPADAQFEVEVLANVAASQNQVADAQGRLQDQEPAAEQTPVATPTMPTDEQIQTMWAAAMIDVAEEFTASLDNIPPAERELVSRRVAALRSTANDLLAGTVSPRLQPGALRAMLGPNAP